MAALVAGVQYGLSSHSNFHENKSLIFVKLTDSAQRAIEDFVRNRSKTSKNPTIQFLGNEGQLSFPSTQSSHGSAGFTFSLSDNQDIEGPQGGFECIQQTGPTSLESLGALPCKMRIQANDDVYETTRHRMAVAEENSKNKCTRVIKANGPDIGRKVKVRGTGRTIPPPSNSRHRDSSSIPSSGSQSRLSSCYKSTTNNNPPPVRSQPEKKISDIMRRPIKERLIHLLALRPYKKPELYDRINREGIKERERSIVTTILKQVAFMRDNTYHLHRYVWNDVQEDWPYYTDQEKTMLKRRKPQNLTPPGSSDGSGSGQSPNSTHAGSPPAITAPPPSVLSTKRPGYYQGNDGLPTKKPRISHYRKPEPNSNSTSRNNENGRTAGSNSVSVVSGGSVSGVCANIGSNVGVVDGWDQRQQQRERRTDYRGERTSNHNIATATNISNNNNNNNINNNNNSNNSEVLRGGSSYATGKPCLTTISSSEENHQSNSRDNVMSTDQNECNAAVNSAGDSHNSHNSVNHSNTVYNSRHYHSGGRTAISSNESTGAAVGLDYVARGVSSAGGAAISGNSTSGSANGANGMANNDRRDRNDRGRGDRDRDSRKRSGATVVTTPYNDYSNVSTSGYNGNGDSTVSMPTCNLDMPESPKSSEYPDYLTYYTTISSTEQRRRYKAEFNSYYEEYTRLHAEVVKVSDRFTQLEERLNQENASGNWDAYMEVKRQIFTEYNETKRDPVQREIKERFHYLHEKLSHIKRLVLEYDTQNCTGNMMMSAANCNNSSSVNMEIKEMDSLRY